jgi:hypothetical protein
MDERSRLALCCRIRSAAKVRLSAIAIVLIIAVQGTSTAVGGAFTLTNTDFQISTRDFETCDLPVAKAQTQRVLALLSIEYHIHIFELSTSSYCIVLTELRTNTRQSVAISNYIFDLAIVNDVIVPGAFVFSIIFRMNANKLGVSLINGKMVLSPQ